MVIAVNNSTRTLPYARRLRSRRTLSDIDFETLAGEREPGMLHINLPTRSELLELAQSRQPGCVSIYIATNPVPNADRLRIELKNAVAAAAEKLVECGSSRIDADRVALMVEQHTDGPEFARRQANSLALFVNREGITSFNLANAVTPTVEVSDRFYIKPLFRALTFPQSAWVLALAQNSVRLLAVSPDTPVEQVEVVGLPTDVASAAGVDSIRGRSPRGRIQGSEGQKTRMDHYARLIDDALAPELGGSGIPLILAGAEPLVGIFRQESRYPLVLDAAIDGNPEARTNEDIGAAARPLLDALYARQLAELVEGFGTRLANGTAVTDLGDVARAATAHAVELLIVDIDRTIPGTVDELTGAVDLPSETNAEDGGAGTYGVADEIVRRALLADARIVAVRGEDVPGGGVVAATVRFPV